MKFPLQKILSWSLAHTAWLSMAFSPLALAQNNTLTTRKIENDLKDIGYNRKMTLGEFWEKTKSNYPDSVIQYFDKTIAENKNILMPDIQISSVKNTDGNEVPALRLSQNGKTQLLQIFGEKKKWAKLNNVNLSEADLFYPAVAMKRIESSDVNIRKAAEKYRQQRNSKQSAQSVLERKKQQQMSKDFARFTGFPRMTPQLWKSMTKEQRAGFIVRMRLLWLNARLVLETAESATPARGKPSAQSTMFEEMYRRLVGEIAWAEDVNTTMPAPASGGTETLAPPPPSVAEAIAARADETAAPMTKSTPIIKYSKADLADPKNRNKPCQSSSRLSGNACIAAGLVAADGQNKYSLVYNSSSPNTLTCACSYGAIVESRSDKENLRTLHNECEEINKDNNLNIKNADKGEWVACNPLLYSYKADSAQPFCVHTMSTGFQRATAFSAVKTPTASCDEQSRLSLTAFNVKNKDNSFLTEEQRIAAIEKEQAGQTYEFTKNYLNGALKRAKKTSLDDMLKGEWTKDNDKALIDIQTAFELEIREATRLCSVQDLKKQEGNYKDACEQLHRRWLFTEKFIAQFRARGCPEGSVYEGAYDSGESVYTADGKKTQKTNINSVHVNKDNNLCRCTATKTSVPIGAKSCSINTGASSSTCPTGMSPESPNGRAGDRRCVCDNGAAGMYTESEAKTKGAAQLCVATQPAGSCSDAPKDKTNFDARTCSCKEGYSLQSKYSSSNNDSELGINASSFPPGKKPQSDEMVCRATSSFPWPWLVPPVLLGLFFLNKNKNKKEPKPPVDNCAPKIAGASGQCTCSPASVAQCAPPQGIYDWSKCECSYKQPITCPDGSILLSNKPNQLESCPKCPDNQYRTAVGCANESEGGKLCTDFNGCGGSSGGIPTSTGQ